MTNTDRNPDTVRDLAKAIDKVFTLNHYNSATFGDVLDLVWYTLTRYHPGAEEAYLETVRRMTPDAVRAVPEVLGILLVHFVLNESYSDLLGPVYMDLAGRWKKKGMGQYFTPWEICVCMGHMTMHEHDWDTCPKPTICEPCVGSGAMLLAIKAVVAEKWGRSRVSALQLSGQDSDKLCVRMAQIQLLLTNDDYMRDWLMVSGLEAAFASPGIEKVGCYEL